MTDNQNGHSCIATTDALSSTINKANMVADQGVSKRRQRVLITDNDRLFNQRCTHNPCCRHGQILSVIANARNTRRNIASLTVVSSPSEITFISSAYSTSSYGKVHTCLYSLITAMPGSRTGSLPGRPPTLSPSRH